jgi:hypothetical protein
MVVWSGRSYEPLADAVEGWSGHSGVHRSGSRLDCLLQRLEDRGTVLGEVAAVFALIALPSRLS